MGTITFNLPDDVHSQFKKYCIDKETSMRKVLNILVERIVKNNKKHK